VVRVVNESERSATDLRVRDQDGKEVTHESALTAYSVETTEIGGSTLYTIKWTGLQPTEAGWSPPSDTLQVHALRVCDLGVSRGVVSTDTLQVHASQCGRQLDLFGCPDAAVPHGQLERLVERSPVGLLDAIE
jgi:hypothetical protein